MALHSPTLTTLLIHKAGKFRFRQKITLCQVCGRTAAGRPSASAERNECQSNGASTRGRSAGRRKRMLESSVDRLDGARVVGAEEGRRRVHSRNGRVAQAV